MILSTEPLPPEEYESMVASADLGLVLYKTIPGSLFRQKNIECIGLSSGKFSHYTKHGLPVISIGQQTYADLLFDYEFGENLSSFDEMPGALSSDPVEARVALRRGEAPLCREARFRRPLAHDRLALTGGDGVDMLRAPSQPQTVPLGGRMTEIEEVQAAGPPARPDRQRAVPPGSNALRHGRLASDAGRVHRLPAGRRGGRHVHVPLERSLVGTSEVLIVRSGRCEMDVYDDDRALVTTRELAAGDVVVIFAGGHGFRMLEDTTFLEVKQGPYTGLDEKERF